MKQSLNNISQDQFIFNYLPEQTNLIDDCSSDLSTSTFKRQNQQLRNNNLILKNKCQKYQQQLALKNQQIKQLHQTYQHLIQTLNTENQTLKAITKNQFQSHSLTQINHNNSNILNKQINDINHQFQKLFERVKFGLLQKWKIQQLQQYRKTLKTKQKQYLKDENITHNAKRIKQRIKNFQNLINKPKTFITKYDQIQQKINKLNKKKSQIQQLPFIQDTNQSFQNYKYQNLQRNIYQKIKSIKQNFQTN